MVCEHLIFALEMEDSFTNCYIDFFFFKLEFAHMFLLFSDSGNKKDPAAFGWSERYKVAMGVAEALEYLHSGSAQRVIHRDVKSSNILLSDDFEPQVTFIFGFVNFSA